jgi:hypothetical protein
MLHLFLIIKIKLAAITTIAPMTNGHPMTVVFITTHIVTAIHNTASIINCLSICSSALNRSSFGKVPFLYEHYC